MKKYLDRILNSNLAFVSSRHGMHAILAGVILWCWFLRSFVFAGVGPDDAEQLIFSQSFDLGYSTGNPPLITWLVILFQQIFGVSVITIMSLKFLLLWLAYYLMWCCAIRVLADERLATLATLSLFAVYYIAWDSVFHYSNSLLMIAFISATFLKVLQLNETPTAKNYAWLGLLIGLGLLAKYTFILFAVPLLVAASFDSQLRQKLIHPLFLITVFIAIIINIPHGYWMIENHALLQQRAIDRFSQLGSENFFTARALGTLEVGRILFDISMPLLAILMVIFWPACQQISWKEEPIKRYHNILARTFLIAISLTLAGSLVFGISRIRSHYMMILLLFPILFFARVKFSDIKAWRLKAYAGTLTFIVCMIIFGLGLKYFVDPKRSGKAYYNIPYPAYAQQLRSSGFTHGTIFADWHTNPIAGNFRAQFPESRVLDYLWTHYTPPKSIKNGKCLIIWTPRSDGSRRREFLNQANLILKSSIDLETPARFLKAEMPPGGRVAQLAFVLVEGQGDCK